MINFKIRLQPHQQYNLTQYEELGFSQLTQLKDDCTINSHHLTCTFLFKRFGECTFLNLGVIRVLKGESMDQSNLAMQIQVSSNS